MDIPDPNANESDNESQSSTGYFTRSKRRKLDTNEVCTSIFRNTERKRKNPISHVPVEILRVIFTFISHQELSQSVRCVNHRFKIVAEDVLNRSFKNLDKKLGDLILTTEVSLGYVTDDIEIQCVAKFLNAIELVKLHYEVVLSNIWRYIFNDYYKTTKTCMYGGKLLDAFYDFFYKCFHSPQTIYSPAVIKEHTLPTEVDYIIHLSKTFCVYFDKVSEESLQDCLICSGCKIIDLVDSAKYMQKYVLSEEASANSFSGEYTYYSRNSWFIALPIPVTKDMEWKQRQRMMHMRLRRIVFAHNDMFLQQDQYFRETMLRPFPLVGRIRRPGNNVYTGYGDVGDTFFFYGVMNDGAYEQKFHQDEDDGFEDADDDVIIDENNNVLNVVPHNNSDEDLFYRIPYLGFRMNIIVNCPLSYAPLNYLKNLNDLELDELKTNHKTKGPTEIKIIFECDGAHYPRLPTRFEYVFNPQEL